jgi:hypothetical protein
MATTVKITDLPAITTVNSNTANTVLVGVDIPTNITGQITLTTLAAGLYSNNNLVVGNNHTVLPNVIAQFTGNSGVYTQVNTENINPNGSGDYVITADDGNDTDHFMDMGLNGSTFSDPTSTYSATKAHDGYLYVSSSGTNKGNLAIGITNATGKVNFVVGGLQTQNIVGYIDSTGIWSNSINSVVTANAASANSVINTRVSANVATLRGEITANVATLRGEITSNVSTINGSITSNNTTVTNLSQAAYNKANSAIANTNGTITAGDFYISGDGYVNGTFVLANSTFGVTESALTIKATETVQPTSQSGTMLRISGKANTPSRVIIDSFSTDGSAYGIVAGRTARGTVTSPTATQNNDVLLRMAGNGWGTTGFAPLGVGRIDIVATENYTDTARGSKIVFYNIPNGSNTVQEIATFNAESVTFDGTVYPAKGFIYDPREFAAAQTAVTIDFANDVVLKANCAADITFSFANFTPGKQVEVWLTNTSGSNRTVTHGCSALNSTINSTTFAIPSTSTAWMKYYCVNGDLANTFVAVVVS